MSKIKSFGVPVDKKSAVALAEAATISDARLRNVIQDARRSLKVLDEEFARKRKMFSPQEWMAVEKPLVKDHKARRNEILKETQAARHEALSQIQQAYGAAKEAQSVLVPIQMLTAHGFGSQRRSQMFAEAKAIADNGGLATLRSLMDRATATGDLEQAAALITVNDGLPSESRAFDSHEVAEFLVGAESQAARDRLLIVEKIWRDAIIANKNLEGLPLTSDEEISVGLIDRKLTDAEHKARVREHAGESLIGKAS